KRNKTKIFQSNSAAKLHFHLPSICKRICKSKRQICLPIFANKYTFPLPLNTIRFLRQKPFQKAIFTIWELPSKAVTSVQKIRFCPFCSDITANRWQNRFRAYSSNTSGYTRNLAPENLRSTSIRKSLLMYWK